MHCEAAVQSMHFLPHAQSTAVRYSTSPDRSFSASSSLPRSSPPRSPEDQVWLSKMGGRRVPNRKRHDAIDSMGSDLRCGVPRQPNQDVCAEERGAKPSSRVPRATEYLHILYTHLQVQTANTCNMLCFKTVEAQVMRLKMQAAHHTYHKVCRCSPSYALAVLLHIYSCCRAFQAV